MASLYGAEYTNVTQDVPSEKAPINKWGGNVRVMYDTYAIAADLASGDKIYLGKLKKGDRVLEVILSTDDLDASGGTLDVGYEYNASGESSLTDDLDAFLANVDVTTSGGISKAMSAQANMPGFGYAVEGDADIVVTVDGDTDVTSGNIKLCVIYAAS
jgi:hypothetical protein